jgi:ABC-type dipeptide/oligopeptide/nickel transport system permease component
MRRLIVNRVFGSLGAVLGASIVSFVILRVVPGNPARLILGPLATQAAVEHLRQVLGLDQSLPVQYWHYISRFFEGEWGYSYEAGDSVSHLIFSRLGASVELALYAFVGAFLAAVLLALLVTYRHRPVLDAFVRGLSFAGLGTPQFWLGLLLLMVLSQSLHLFPGPVGRLNPGAVPPPSITGLYTIDALLAGRLGTLLDALWHLVLPAFCLGFFAFGYLVRLLRANLLEVSREPYLLVARSKGPDRWRTFVRHALPNAFLPTLTASGLLLAQLLAGSVLVESVFDWPGVGQLVVESIQRSDYGVVQTFILLSAVVYVAVNLVVDVLYGLIDPRARITGAAS